MGLVPVLEMNRLRPYSFMYEAFADEPRQWAYASCGYRRRNMAAEVPFATVAAWSGRSRPGLGHWSVRAPPVAPTLQRARESTSGGCRRRPNER